MDKPTITLPSTPKRRRWFRSLAWIFGVLVLLLVAAYFVGTSAAFFKGVILPRVGQSIHATVTVTDASISPFSEVVLGNLKVMTSGEEPLVSAAEVSARYSLMDILRGNIHVDDVTLSSATVIVVENPDGTHNYDPLLKAPGEKPKEPKPAVASQATKPPRLDVRRIAFKDATVRQIKRYKTGTRDVRELGHVDITAEGVKNGQSGKLSINAELKLENNPPPPATNGVLQGKISGNFAFALTPELKPASIQGKALLNVIQAGGGMADLAALGMELNCDITPTDIKQVALRFQKKNAPLGQVLVSGPFDLAKNEGKLNVQVLSIDKHVLNLVGASSGLDFSTTMVNASNEVSISKSGSLIAVNGQVKVDRFQLIRKGQATPTLDLMASYDETADLAARTSLLKALTLTGQQGQNPLLRAELTSPMTIAWGNSTNAVGDSALNLTVTHLNLADWKPFIGDVGPSGDANLKLTLLSEQAGKKLTFDLDSLTDNLTAGTGTNQITQASLLLQARGQATDLKQFSLSDYKLQVSRQNEPFVSVSGSATYDTAAKNADAQVNGQITLARLVQALSRPDLTISSGTAELKAHLLQTTLAPGTKNESSVRNVSGSVSLAGFTGKVGNNEFRGFGSTLDLEASMTPQQIQIRKLTGKLTQGPNDGGSFDLAATYKLTDSSAQFTAKVAGFNQAGLGPILEPMLADRKLVSVGINGTASGEYHTNGESGLKADLQIANLVVRDPKNQFPETPLEAKLQVDASMRNQVAEVRQFVLGLAPTTNAPKNEVRLQGQVDLSKTNTIQANLKLIADSLDLTRYYDLFAGEKKGPAKQTSPAPSQTRPAAASAPVSPSGKEPAGRKFSNFTADVNIKRLYLRELELTNLQASAKMNGRRVAVKPLQVAVNGAPLNAVVQVNLGVPGYSYDLNLNAQHVPFAPLVNTFEPERRGELKGTLTATAQISGTGTDGASLQKTLTGQFDIGATNLDLAIKQLRSPFMKLLVNVIAIVPTLVKNPTAGVGSLVGSLVGGPAAGGGWADELQQSPINVVQARGVIGSGRVDLERALVQSPAFQAETHGPITLAEVLTNSTLNLPLSISVRRGLAEKINFVPAGTPTNVAFVKLPEYVTIVGTVGNPKEKLNKTALLGTALQQLGGNIPGVNKQTGSLIEGLGGLLTGRQPAASNAPPGGNTNQSPVNSLLDQFLKPKKK